LWYGTEDTIIPESMSKYLSKELPTSKIKYIENAGHFLSENDEVIADINGILSEK
jgi:pimeloyl-ACP methyl ester carboxylesterase